MDPTAASLPIVTADGFTLGADLTDAGAPAGAAVICHPHPQYGGNRFNAVVDAVFRALPPSGVTALRFDFRPGAGTGADLAAERRDVAAALDALHDHCPDLPLFTVGYSFGAAVGLSVRHPDVRAMVAVAPPLTFMPLDGAPTVPTLVLVPAHDQFAGPDAVAPIVAGWPDATMEVVDTADHFLAGRTATVADRVAEWLATVR